MFWFLHFRCDSHTKHGAAYMNATSSNGSKLQILTYVFVRLSSAIRIGFRTRECEQAASTQNVRRTLYVTCTQKAVKNIMYDFAVGSFFLTFSRCCWLRFIRSLLRPPHSTHNPPEARPFKKYSKFSFRENHTEVRNKLSMRPNKQRGHTHHHHRHRRQILLYFT